MDFVCALDYFSTRFESAQVAVKVSFVVGNDAISKRYADEIMARKETDCQTPRMYFVCTLARFSLCFESA